MAATHYNYFRDYEPSIGRYVQSDPIGLDGGLNTFGYVGANPVRSIDPSGQAAFVLPGLVWLGDAVLCGAAAYSLNNLLKIISRGERNTSDSGDKSDKLPMPPKPGDGCRCYCRARENNNADTDCKNCTMQRFAIAEARADSCDDAKKKAKTQAKDALGAQAKHDDCVCVNSKGDIFRRP